MREKSTETQNPVAVSPQAQGTAYEPPQVTVLGDVVRLTNGSSSNDTADMKNYYY